MTNPETPPSEPLTTPDPAGTRHVEIRDEGDRMVAEAEVTTAQGPEGTVRTSMHAQSGHVRPGQRASLVDAVMDLPEVQASERVEAAVPYGDGESLERLRERTENAQTRAAGATTLLDASIPASQEPAGQPSVSAGKQPAAAGQPPAPGEPPAADEPADVPPQSRG